MSVNTFFLLVFGLLIGMFAYFKPAYSSDKNFGEIPAIQLQSFTLYEISRNGIDHILEGQEGKKFDNRYELDAATFADNTKRLSQHVSAAKAVYKDDIVDLKGEVLYRRADGMQFRSNEGQYNTATSEIRTNGAFEITQNANRVDGTKLYYNTEKDFISADRIRGVYQLD